MFYNYLRTALRSLWSHKGISFINIAGLAVGLGGCLLIMGYVIHEVNFEDCHANRDRIFRVDGHYVVGDSRTSMASIMMPVGPALKEAIPEIEEQVRLYRAWDVPVKFAENDVVVEGKFFYADPSVFQVFTFPLKQGDPSTALQEPFSVVISEETAEAHFSEDSPLGRTIQVNDSIDLKVTGVLENVPANTQLRCNYLASHSTLSRIGEDVESWADIFKDYTYLLLKEGTDPYEVEQKIPAILQQHMGEVAERYDLHLQSLSDIYLHSGKSYELPPQGSVTYITVFSVVAGLMLFLACVNYVSLATARTSSRTKEVSVRKMVGAGRGQLFNQFLSESVVLSCLSMLLGMVFYEWGSLQLESFLGRDLEIGFASNPGLWAVAAALVFVVGVLSGSYPALVLSRSRPTTILRGIATGRASKSLLRRLLVVFQFSIAIGILCITVGVNRQLEFIASRDLGFDAENMYVLELGDEFTADHAQRIKNAIAGSSNVISASLAQNAPGENRYWLMSIRPEDRPHGEEEIMNILLGDQDFTSAFGIEVTRGESLPRERTDVSPRPMLINEAAVQQFDLVQPVGSMFLAGDYEYQVVGVVRDFNCHSLQNAVMPMAIFNSRSYHRLLAVKLLADDMAAALTEIRSTWEQVAPDTPFDGRFLTEMIGDNYRDVRKMRTLFTVFSGLAMLIACLGIFGLASFSAQRRSKEIGIRKVLGSTVSGVVGLLSKEYLILVTAANLIAWPVAYSVMNRWLAGEFAYHLDVGFDIFLESGLLTFAIALATVSYQAIRAARANPVEALKYE